MSAGAALQVALAAGLQAFGEPSVFDGPPARAAFPYVVVDAGNERDWSHNSGAGREVMVGVTLWDDQPARLNSRADSAEQAVAAASAISGWQLVSLALIRRRVVRDVAGPWAITIDFRARLLALPPVED
jgi:hypothetical protein